MSEEKVSEVLNEAENLIPSGQVAYYTFGNEDLGTLTCKQRPLSFFGKIELFALLGGAVENALKEGGLSVAEFLGDTPDNIGQLGEADNFVQTIARFVQYAPEFLLDLYVIALGVPKGEREYVKAVMELHEDDGGLSDDQGMEILQVFLDQNWTALLDFFKEKIVPLVSRMTSGQAPGSASSKRSKATVATTQKA